MKTKIIFLSILIITIIFSVGIVNAAGYTTTAEDPPLTVIETSMEGNQVVTASVIISTYTAEAYTFYPGTFITTTSEDDVLFHYTISNEYLTFGYFDTSNKIAYTVYYCEVSVSYWGRGNTNNATEKERIPTPAEYISGTAWIDADITFYKSVPTESGNGTYSYKDFTIISSGRYTIIRSSGGITETYRRTEPNCYSASTIYDTIQTTHNEVITTTKTPHGWTTDSNGLIFTTSTTQYTIKIPYYITNGVIYDYKIIIISDTIYTYLNVVTNLSDYRTIVIAGPVTIIETSHAGDSSIIATVLLSTYSMKIYTFNFSTITSTIANGEAFLSYTISNAQNVSIESAHIDSSGKVCTTSVEKIVIKYWTGFEPLYYVAKYAEDDNENEEVEEDSFDNLITSRADLYVNILLCTHIPYDEITTTATYSSIGVIVSGKYTTVIYGPRTFSTSRNYEPTLYTNSTVSMTASIQGSTTITTDKTPTSWITGKDGQYYTVKTTYHTLSVSYIVIGSTVYSQLQITVYEKLYVFAYITTPKSSVININQQVTSIAKQQINTGFMRLLYISELLFEWILLLGIITTGAALVYAKNKRKWVSFGVLLIIVAIIVKYGPAIIDFVNNW